MNPDPNGYSGWWNKCPTHIGRNCRQQLSSSCVGAGILWSGVKEKKVSVSSGTKSQNKKKG